MEHSMRKTKFLVILGILAIFMTLMACPPAANALTQADAIVGKKWQDDYTDWNTHSSNGLTYDCQIGVNFVETASYGRQEGTIYQKKINETSGYIYYQITNTASFKYSSKPASEYLNKWYAIYYKDLTENSVTMCDACPKTDSISDYCCTDSLNEAVTTLTVENNYFAYPIAFTIVTQ